MGPTIVRDDDNAAFAHGQNGGAVPDNFAHLFPPAGRVALHGLWRNEQAQFCAV
jgi:hypothetical protein